MNDRVYPSAKQAANGGGAAENGGANSSFPANKAQLYNATRPAYRPQPPPRRRSRKGCFCACCLWTTVAILCLIFLAAVAGVVFYIIYRPHRPSFSVNSLRLSRFNLTDTSVTSNFNISVTARNPNKKISFFYDPVTVRILSGDLEIGDGAFPAFAHARKNVTTLRAVVSSSNSPIPDGTDISSVKSSLKSKNLPLKIELETKVKAKIGKIETKKLKVRVICDGIKISVPAGKAATATAAATTNVKCKVDPRIKIIKWTV
ncbi:NDR1/HIN1-like protein 6 [Andrographis paniculata]|uniref:NDR1/HIN1-like protein 6 n=1 Tax=Andrographis paniculata TaxID=175694 RepID=UPI0021E94A19|nr:NDR1/HIN1-like protein 6 [Andrographis paniculata]